MKAFSTYYNVEIQMSGLHEATEHFVSQIAEDLGTDSTAIEERETYRAVLSFKSHLKPETIRTRVKAILIMYKMTVHYIDVIYRYEYEMTPDRFCAWTDGHEQDYTGKIIFTEDK